MSEAQRREAAEHMARCADCVVEVGRLYERTVGHVPGDVSRLTALFGCDQVQNRLHRLAMLDAEALRREEPAAAAHVAWCVACRTRLATLLDVEADAAAGLFDAAVVDSPSQGRTWAQVVIAVQGGLARFRELPVGMVPMTTLVPATTPRGSSVASSLPDAPTHTMRFPVGDGGAAIEVRLAPHGPTAIDMELALVGEDQALGTLQLRTSDAAGAETLVAWHPLRRDAPAVIRDVPTGDYWLDIGDSGGLRRCRVPLRVARDA